jgi:SLT domain-containing protein
MTNIQTVRSTFQLESKRCFRRELTKGQKAMATAMRYTETRCGAGRGNKSMAVKAAGPQVSVHVD